jgi:hypothetical protein
VRLLHASDGLLELVELMGLTQVLAARQRGSPSRGPCNTRCHD